MATPHSIIVHNQWALGDTVCLSALIRDIQRAYPGQYQLHMSGHYLSFWDNNPYCQRVEGTPYGLLYKPEYLEGIKAAGRGIKKHFLSWFHEDFKKFTGITVPVTEPKGDIHLSRDEKVSPFPGRRYWVIVAGGKLDMTAKLWDAQSWQLTVDALKKLDVDCVQAGANFTDHFHMKLRNVDNWVGKTDSIRELFRLLYNCEGVICGITGPMHIAACFDKPCVVIAGGREEPWWEAYSNCYFPDSFGEKCSPVQVEHTFLHTMGLLDCEVGNLTHGCWKDRTVPVEKADLVNRKRQQQLCRRPLRLAHQAVPECMKLITPEHVVEAVMNYYEKGILPPVGQPKGKYKHLLEVPADVPQPLMVPSNYPLVDSDGKQVGWSGELTAHAVDHSTTPPTEHVTIIYDHETLRQIADPLPAEVKPIGGEPPEYGVLDHPYLGGKVTVFVLCYGDHLDLAKRCLGSIMDKTPSRRIDLRVALNQPSQAVLNYVSAFGPQVITKIYLDRGTRKKYPAMREMFWDSSCPIKTSYVCWFDDDSHVLDNRWLAQLGQAVVANHLGGCRLYGTKYVHDLAFYKKQGFHPEKWFRGAPWWKDRWMHMADGQRLAPNGSQIVFATGGFWALATETIREANIPDPRLIHNGGDITIGEQVHQAGYKICDFARGKKPVCWSDARPRGSSHNGPGKEFPWSKVV